MAERQGVSRRQFLQVVGGTAAAAAVGASVSRPPYALAAPASTESLTVLAYNENPFGLFPSAREAVIAAAASGNRYPKQTADALRDDVARLLGVDSEMIVLGSGSIEPLKIATELFCTPGQGPVVADPTFEAVVIYAGLSNIEPIKVPLTADHRLDLDHMLDRRQGRRACLRLQSQQPDGGDRRQGRDARRSRSRAPATSRCWSTRRTTSGSTTRATRAA